MPTTFFSRVAGLQPSKAKVRIVWAHGWGQDHRALQPLAEALYPQATHLLLDFPGFGKSPAPGKPWTIEDYADASARLLLRTPFRGPTIWVGHSFGCRVGLMLAAKYPGKLQGLFLIAAAGLPPRRGPLRAARLAAKVAAFKTMKHLYRLTGQNVEKLRARHGSADYRNAGPMRETFLNTIRQDLSPEAARVGCPAFLLYGANDNETPPNIGTRLQALMPDAHLEVLPGEDHYSLLAGARHQTLSRLQAFMLKVTQ
jgi:pimeloyl-ACP methyl ester carboxylesterase